MEGCTKPGAVRRAATITHTPETFRHAPDHRQSQHVSDFARAQRRARRA
jgi:hypothetical protein